MATVTTITKDEEQRKRLFEVYEAWLNSKKKISLEELNNRLKGITQIPPLLGFDSPEDAKAFFQKLAKKQDLIGLEMSGNKPTGKYYLALDGEVYEGKFSPEVMNDFMQRSGDLMKDEELSKKVKEAFKTKNEGTLKEAMEDLKLKQQATVMNKLRLAEIKSEATPKLEAAPDTPSSDRAAPTPRNRGQ